MTTLFLDFASHRKYIAVTDGARTAAWRQIDDHTQESTLLPEVESLLAEAGVRMDALDRIAATTGPGGFMSLRVGLTLASTLAWGLNIPIGGVHLSHLWRSRTRTSTNVLWLHSTKKELLFVRKGTEDPELRNLTGLRDELKDADYVGELIPEHANALSVKPATDLSPLEDALPGLLDGLAYTTSPLLPWYGRGI